MDKQNPFSIYDFLGYLIPGALVLYILLFLYKAKSIFKIKDVETAIISNSKFELDKFMFFIIISYALGHLINFISSITIERYANWKYNYPSKYLMDFNNNFKFWQGTKTTIFWKIVLIIIIFPITCWDYILGELLGFKRLYTKKADDFIIQLIKLKGIKLIEKLGLTQFQNLSRCDFQRIFYHYSYEYSKNHQSKLSNYVALYGFLRTLALITNLLFWGIIIVVIIYFNQLDDSFIFPISIFLFTISIVSYIFFMAFMKFYRRFSLEGLMVIAIDKELV
ncbi:hypothetical protein OBK01_06335 [Empedobacter falsenii]